MTMNRAHRERMKALGELIELSRPLERVMVFIDGGYLRELSKHLYGHDKIDFAHLSRLFIRMFNAYGEPTNPFQANLIRIYYYDAIVDEGHPDYEAQRRYFESIEDEYAYTVRLGKLVESSKKERPKQKGVDTLMAIDALTKAYTHQYDTGMFMIGDRDFIPVVEAVKDAGKKTMCVYYPPSTSRDLVRIFDMHVSLDKQTVKKWSKG